MVTAIVLPFTSASSSMLNVYFGVSLGARVRAGLSSIPRQEATSRISTRPAFAVKRASTCLRAAQGSISESFHILNSWLVVTIIAFRPTSSSSASGVATSRPLRSRTGTFRCAFTTTPTRSPDRDSDCRVLNICAIFFDFLLICPSIRDITECCGSAE